MRLLLAEDEIELSNALAVILRHNSYSVDVVHNGVDALNYLATGNYDGAILDVMMPKLDGITVLRRLRAEGNKIPVLILTAKSEVDDCVLGLDSGADDYMTKPFEMKELLARVRAMLRRNTGMSDSVLVFGNMTLDRTTCKLSTPYGSLRLANKEYQMLEMLMINPGQLISTERFMERIWGYNSEAEINVVWVYLSYLRKKMAQVKSNVKIKVTRNRGYSLEVHS